MYTIEKKHNIPLPSRRFLVVVIQMSLLSISSSQLDTRSALSLLCLILSQFFVASLGR